MFAVAGYHAVICNAYFEIILEEKNPLYSRISQDLDIWDHSKEAQTPIYS